MNSTLDRFTAQANQVLSLAHQEAESLGHAEVGSEHLVLGLLREENGVAGRVLRDLGLELTELRKQVHSPTANGKPDDVQIELSHQLKQVLKVTVDQADRLGHDRVGTEHLLLAVLIDEKSAGRELLEGSGVTLEAVRERDLTIAEGPIPFRSDIARPPRSTHFASCPRDNSTLKSKFIAGVQGFQCPTCQGLLIRKVSLGKLYDVTNMPTPRALSKASVNRANTVESSLACPDDGTQMLMRTLKDTDVELCPNCEAVWLDEGELDSIWARYKEGAGPMLIPKPQKLEAPSFRELVLIVRATAELIEGTIVDFIEDLLDSRR